MSGRILPQIVTDGLILYLDAGNTISYPGSGTTWKDLSPTVANGILTNGPTFNNGNGGSISFDGTNDYIDCGRQIPVLTPSLPITIDCWVNVNTGSPLGGLVTLDSASPTVNYYGAAVQIGGTSPNYSVIASYGNGGLDQPSNRQTFATSTTFSSGNWVHIITVIQSTITNTTVYFNTVSQAGTTSGTGGAIAWSSTGTTKIGRVWGPGASYFSGKIANVKVYNRALSTTEISQNYNALRSRFGL